MKQQKLQLTEKWISIRVKKLFVDGWESFPHRGAVIVTMSVTGVLCHATALNMISAHFHLITVSAWGVFGVQQKPLRAVSANEPLVRGVQINTWGSFGFSSASIPVTLCRLFRLTFIHIRSSSVSPASVRFPTSLPRLPQACSAFFFFFPDWNGCLFTGFCTADEGNQAKEGELAGQGL